MSRVCALVVGVLLAVMPSLSHTCDFGCDTTAATAPPPVTASADEADCPLHAATSPATDHHHSSHGSTPCDHDGHDQAIGADAGKIVRLHTLTGDAAILCPFTRLSPVASIAAVRSIERPARASSAITTRSILRI